MKANEIPEGITALVPINTNKIRSWQWDWDIHHTPNYGIPQEPVRDRFQYLTIEMQDGTVYRFIKDMFTDNIKLL